MITKRQQIPKSKQDKKKEREFFGRHIDDHCDYDLIGSKTYGEVLEKLGLSDADKKLKILDTGCGTGVWSERLVQFGHSVTAVDMSHKMIQIARGKSDSGDKHFHVFVGDMEALPLKADIFDVCFGGGVLHHFPSLAEALKELKRVSKQSGRICFLEPNGSNPLMRLSYLLRGVFDHFIDSSGQHASVNEHTHKNNFYENHCRRYWETVRIIPFHMEWARDPSHKSWFLVGIIVRNWLMDMLNRCLPARYGCNCILVVGEGGRRDI